MTAQPLAIVGGLFALWITGTSLNMISMIGLVLLMGLVAKNSILLVDLRTSCGSRAGRPTTRCASVPGPDATGADDVADGDPGAHARGASASGPVLT